MYKLMFLGAGKMATAIAGGLVKSGLLNAANMCAFDVNAAAAAAFAAATGIAAKSSGANTLAAQSETILIAVKPQMIAPALNPVRAELQGKLLLSIAAGITLETLTALTGNDRIVRIMPNTPALVGAGAAAIAPGAGASDEDVELTMKIFSATGCVVKLKESEIDAVTALSGSGPAYVFEFIQAMADGGVAEGLPRDVALQLAAQTVLGAAKMVLETGEHPTSLKDKVTSPAGTTSRALELLAERGFAGSVMQAVRAAAKRSRELGGK
ncbi:MAG: pyrroline-5-carboxylate reductase [Lentisphaeria bacterium]|nr:pyrroline-5-carboxylate reductase [Lentisphaeria bacterium]